MSRKSALDHLDPSRAPHIVHVIPRGAPGYREANGGSMVVSTPAEVDAIIRNVGSGEVVTLDDIRQAIARRHGTAVACPVSTAIFINMAARAAEERRARRQRRQSDAVVAGAEEGRAAQSQAARWRRTPEGVAGRRRRAFIAAAPPLRRLRL